MATKDENMVVIKTGRSADFCTEWLRLVSASKQQILTKQTYTSLNNISDTETGNILYETQPRNKYVE